MCNTNDKSRNEQKDDRSSQRCKKQHGGRSKLSRKAVALVWPVASFLLSLSLSCGGSIMSLSCVASLSLASSVSSLALAPNHSYLGLSCADASLHLYHIQASTSASLELSSPIHSLYRSNNGSETTQPNADTTTLTTHTKGINEITWLCDSSALVSASDDTSLIVWRLSHPSGSVSTRDAAKEARLSLWRQLLGHTGPVFSVSSAPTALWIASGSFDQTIRLWDPIQGNVSVHENQTI